jgi:hypothetical protein
MSGAKNKEYSALRLRNRRTGETLIIRDLRRDEDFAEYESNMQNEVAAGDKGALLRLICECFRTGRAVPQWAQEKFQNAIDKVGRLETKSWDEVFGRPLKKGKQMEAARRRAKLSTKIWNRVRELNAAGEPISKPLFAKIGKEFGVSATIADDMYFEQKK